MMNFPSIRLDPPAGEMPQLHAGDMPQSPQWQTPGRNVSLSRGDIKVVDGVDAAIVSWMQQALCEERGEVERLLTQRHEAMLLRLQRAPVVEAQEQTAQQPILEKAQEQAVQRPIMEEQATQPPINVKVLPSLSLKTALASPSEAMHDRQGQVQVKTQSALPSGAAYKTLTSASCARRQNPEFSQKVHVEAELCESIILSEQANPASDGYPSWKDALGHVLDAISGFSTLIFIVLVACWREYKGFDVGFLFVNETGFQDSRPAEQIWPHAHGVFTRVEWFFGCSLCLELIVRIAFRIRLWPDLVWNSIDAIIVTTFVIERATMSDANISQNPTSLRLARFIRLFRLLKLVRHVQAFSTLHLIIKSIWASMAVLAWTSALLLLIMALVAIGNAYFLSFFIMDDSHDIGARKDVYLRWGTFLRAFVSMFEATLANWGPPCWLLMDHVGEYWGLFFIAWRCCVGFAVIQVITSVFIQQTFKTAGREENLMIQEKQHATECYLRHLDRLWTRLDDAGTGLIAWVDFESALEEPRVRHWFGALEIDVSDAPKLFMLLDDGDGFISKDEFILGLRKLKGVAQSIDIVQLQKDCQRIRKILGDPGADKRNSQIVMRFQETPQDGGLGQDGMGLGMASSRGLGVSMGMGQDWWSKRRLSFF